MKLLKTILVVIFFMFLISVFQLNKNVELQVNYFGLAKPLNVQFWELVVVCVALGVIISALWDFFSELKWLREKRKMIKTHKEHKSVQDRLNGRIEELEEENRALKQEIEKLPRGTGGTSKPLTGPGAIAPRESAAGTVVAAPTGAMAKTGAPAPTISRPSVTPQPATETGTPKQPVSPESPGTLSGLGKSSVTRESPSTKSAAAPLDPVAPKSPEQEEPSKKSGFLSRFGRSAAKTEAPPVQNQPVDKTTTPDDKSPEKKTGLFGRFGKNSGKDEPTAALGKETPPKTSEPEKPLVPASKPSLPGADTKPGQPDDKGSADKPKEG